MATPKKRGTATSNFGVTKRESHDAPAFYERFEPPDASEDDLGLLLRGEVIWRKGEGAGGNCAWGSFRSPTNPVLRDITERVLIASKGRFDRAKGRAERELLGLPFGNDILAEDFMADTLDV